MEALSKLFGNETKVKIMRLFLFNPERIFGTSDITKRVNEEGHKVRRELSTLEKIGLIKRRFSSKIKGNESGFVMNQQFVYLLPLQNFLINIAPLHPKEIIRKITKLGSIKLIVISGVFIQETESRVDILIVGDGVKKGVLENNIKVIESEIGKELRYAYFTTEDFKYRLNMYDKLVRDILDYPHKKVLNRLGIV